MINWRIIWKIIGQLLVIEAGMMALCMLLSFLYQEDDTPAFFIAVVATIVGACVMHYAGRGSSNTMYRRDSFLVVTLVWVIFSFF